MNTVRLTSHTGESLKVIKREPDLWRVRVDEVDDLWTLAHLCQKGRFLGMLGERRDQTTAGQEGGRAKAAERKRMWIVLRIENHENHAFSDVLRVHGIIEEAPIDKGSHHTHMVAVGDEVELRAESFPKTDIDLLQKSANSSGKGRLAIAVVEHDEVNLFEVATHGIREVAQFTLRGGGKYTGGSNSSQTVQDSFRSKVARDMHMQLSDEMPLLLCGPGLARDKMLAEFQNTGRVVKSVATSIGGRPGANEVLSSGLAGELLEHHGLVNEIQLLSECWRRIAVDEPVAYGQDSLVKAMSEGAIETLLINAETLRSDSTIDGKSWSDWSSGLSDIGANLVQCSTEHDDGQQLLSFGGVIALLRFKI